MARKGRGENVKVLIVERIFTSPKDDVGAEYNSLSMDTESPEFEKYLDDFHVLDKYRKGPKAARYYGVIERSGKTWARYHSYFSGWFMDFARDKPIWERRYIEIVEPIESAN